MAIQIDIPTVPETLVHDKIFMTSINIKQTENSDDTTSPRYDISIEYKTYAVDSTNVRHFSSKSYTIDVLDYLQAATGKATLGDTTMLTALLDVEAVVALLITDKGPFGNAQVTV